MRSPFSSPVTREQARDQLGDNVVDHLLRCHRWQAPHRGVLVPHPEPLNRIEQLLAAVRTQPAGHGWLGLRSAGELWELPVPIDQQTAHLVVPRSAQTRHRTGLRLHRAHLDEAEQGEHRGVPVTSAVRTVLDLARELPRGDAVIAADQALRRGLCTKDELVAGLDRLAGLRGVRAAREVIALCEPGVDSPPETVFRLALIDGGLPRPEPNFVLCDGWGYPIMRGDLVYRIFLLWLEYDGYLAHSDRATFRRDRTRRRELERRGWQVKQFSDVDLRDRVALVTEVRDLITGAPARITALPPHLSTEVEYARRQLHLS